MLRTDTDRLADSIPADIHYTLVETPNGRRLLDVTVIPHAYGIVELVRAPGLSPLESSLSNGEIDRPWRTVATPMKTIHMRGDLDVESVPGLNDVLLVLETVGLPQGAAADRVAAWLPQERATWRARSVFIVRALGRQP
jgi:hypothetical protein